MLAPALGAVHGFSTSGSSSGCLRPGPGRMPYGGCPGASISTSGRGFNESGGAYLVMMDFCLSVHRISPNKTAPSLAYPNAFLLDGQTIPTLVLPPFWPM